MGAVGKKSTHKTIVAKRTGVVHKLGGKGGGEYTVSTC